jgi:hypothetical protein
VLGYEHNLGSKPMTLPSKGNNLTDEEFREMAALKNAINQMPQAVVPEKLETFTEYLVRSLRERGG